MNYHPLIGLEIHIELLTNSKMFSCAPNTYGQEANTKTAPLDFAFPGTMPSINKQAVIHALRMCNALHMEIDHELIFERKNYFYSDLPKGYQITQESRPIGRNGYVTIDNNKIEIERLHLEEDTCKQLHYDNYTLLDYNRAGIPLIEVVTTPSIYSPKLAKKFVEHIRDIVTYLEVSDGRMENGSLRVDVNVSLINDKNSKKYNKVEIKNLNSITNIERAIEYEMNRQTNLLKEGKTIEQETRRYDDKNKETLPLRKKEDAVDYRFFIDTNIAPIKLSYKFIEDAISSSKELKEERLLRYKRLGLSEYDASLLVDDKDISDYYDSLLTVGVDPKIGVNFINGEIRKYLNKTGQDIKHFCISVTSLAQLLRLYEEEKISYKQARDIFDKMLNANKSVDEIVKESDFLIISSEEELIKIINKILDDNEQAISDFKAGKKRALGYIVGLVMKKTMGKANPSLTTKLVNEMIIRR